MVATTLVFGLLLGANTLKMSEVTGSVTYRERMALATGAVVTVSLDRFRADEHVNISEVTIHPEGLQVPFAFRLPYNPDAVQVGDRYGVRARITNGGVTLFETESHVMVVANGKNTADITLVRASTAAMPEVQGVTWSLLSINGRSTEDIAKPPSIILNENGHDFGGNTGVNGFGGVYEWDAPSIMLDPQVSTMMAGSEEQMAMERDFLNTLQIATKLTIEEGELVLYRGSREVMRFRRG